MKKRLGLASLSVPVNTETVEKETVLDNGYCIQYYLIIVLFPKGVKAGGILSGFDGHPLPWRYFYFKCLSVKSDYRIDICSI
jgi:hypothetical protein